MERIDREASEFLSCVTLEAQFRKGRDRQGQSISPLVDRVFGQILPEVRREFERSSEWRRYQEGLLNVAHAQASGTAPEASTRKAQDVANAEDRPAVPRAGESSAAGGMRKFPSFRPHAWERVEIAFLSDQRIQVWIDGRPEKTYNYAEFGCADRRSERPNKAWQMLLLLAQAGGQYQRLRVPPRLNGRPWRSRSKDSEQYCNVISSSMKIRCLSKRARATEFASRSGSRNPSTNSVLRSVIDKSFCRRPNRFVAAIFLEA